MIAGREFLTDERIAFDRYVCAVEDNDAARAMKMLEERRKRWPSAASWNETRSAWDRYACAALEDGAGVTMAARKADAMLLVRVDLFGKVG